MILDEKDAKTIYQKVYDVEKDHKNDQMSRLFSIMFILQEAKVEVELLRSELNARLTEKLNIVETNRLTSLCSGINEAVSQLKMFMDVQSYSSLDTKSNNQPENSLALKDAFSIDIKEDLCLKVEPFPLEDDYEDDNYDTKYDTDDVEPTKEVESSEVVKKEEVDSDDDSLENFNEDKVYRPKKHKKEKEAKDNDPFKCLACDKIFKIKADFSQHLKQHNRAYLCTCCDKTFASHSSLKRHIYFTTNKDLAVEKCHICDKEFSVRYMKEHLKKQHQGLPKYENCPICGEAKQNIKKHLMMHSEPTFECDICLKKFVTQGRLNEHRKIHDESREFQCEICNKGFRTERNLKLHHLVHTGEKSHTCDLCGSSFKQKPHLKEHIRQVHEGIKRTNRQPSKKMQCGKCGQLCCNRQTLQNHEKTHTATLEERKTEECNTCLKAFISKQKLRRHIKIVHMGYKPYTCEVCEKGFANKQALNEHMPTHTGEAAYKCQMCEKSFKQLRGLCAHKKRCLKQM